MRPTVPWQRGLWFFDGHLFVPSSGSDGAGKGLGAAWTTGGGTVAHATPSAAFPLQWKRTTYTQVVTTANQELGPRQSLASEYAYWCGDERCMGGFYMSAIFTIEAWDDDTGRLFVGLTGDANAVCISDTVPNNTCGLWHDSTMGQDVFWAISKNNAGTTNNTQITQHTGGGTGGVSEYDGILATGSTLMWEMWYFPNGFSEVNLCCKLSWFDTTVADAPDSKALNRVRGIEYVQPTSLTNTVFMAPQVQMSNGPTDTTAGHFSIGVVNIYVAPWAGETH